ncbi:hypothetical protein [Streptomyces sp. NPDC096323]|uniref:hypothetical protein n=1 Tax=Streptomyces sp. NPDC096323 TaxID=3155822 RepID=UPI00331CBF71
MATGPAPRRRRPDAGRDGGRWALGGRTALNGNDGMKQAQDPLRVRERIERVYERQGLAAIDPGGRHGRFRDRDGRPGPAGTFAHWVGRAGEEELR